MSASTPKKKLRLDEGKAKSGDGQILSAAAAQQLEDGPLNSFTQKPFSQRYFDILKKRRQLPVHQQRDEFLELVRQNQIVLLVGETGSGKTTQYVAQRSFSFGDHSC